MPHPHRKFAGVAKEQAKVTASTTKSRSRQWVLGVHICEVCHKDCGYRNNLMCHRKRTHGLTGKPPMDTAKKQIVTLYPKTYFPHTIEESKTEVTKASSEGASYLLNSEGGVEVANVSIADIPIVFDNS